MNKAYKLQGLGLALLLTVFSGVGLSISATESGTSVVAAQPQRTVTGVVLDSQSNPLEGVAIMQKGTTNGVMTDAGGRFSIMLPGDGAEISAMCLGYATKNVFVAASHTGDLTIFLAEDAVSLEETVVVGYGTQKKVNLTGAISTVSSEKLESRSASTLTHMLQGSVPGLNITTSSGRPGNSASINIRGVNSINGGNPLVLIDGVEGDMSRVNPNDVAAISVIKDASAAAIYGARASFGVILITTKSGSDGD